MNALSVTEVSPETFLLNLGSGESALVRWRFKQWYLPEEPELVLAVALWCCPESTGLFVVLKEELDGKVDLELLQKPTSLLELRQLADAWRAPLLNLNRALLLEPVAIAKPWGQEIWYTGMEQRGLSAVTDGRYSVPLAWLLGLLPELLMGVTELGENCSASGVVRRAPNLLKILDPLPEPVYGDLYFELHEEKREVYVVTHVDRSVWPDGVGGIRFGFDPVMRASFDDEHLFREAYLEAVEDYREVRVEVDGLIDELRKRDGFPLNEPVPAEQTKSWQEELPADLRAREAVLRATMDAFTRMRPLRTGDVVTVPLLMPHALQHGVRAVEFQTPVYERKILSFAQKVLTQGHWDSAEAVAMMSPDHCEGDDLEVLEDTGQFLREQVVRFEDFEVQRLVLQPEVQWQLPPCSSYSLMMLVQGSAMVGDQPLEPEQALFVPAACTKATVTCSSSRPCVLLLSRPVVQ
ncbi:MAG TPA: hypothetical protein DCF62_05960 [Porticoccaceae bacterium]|nr:hypothetical protein [Porticoccaceae bacterium]HCO60709.1 hypothetical protein [Porticoccaceae bacterium]